MLPKKIISLILSIAIISATLPVISFAEGEEQTPYIPNRPNYESFDPEATQEPFSNVPVPHTEVVPDNVTMEDAVEVEQTGTISASDVIENVLPEMADPSAVISTTSTTDSDKWNSLFANRFGDAYLSPYKKSDGHTVSGQTNRLTIRETDLSLPGKNGLDLNITRYYDNQYYNNGFFGALADTAQGVFNFFYLYKFIDSRNNSPVYIAFYTQDDFYYYSMENGITISEYPTSASSKVTCTINGNKETCYYFDNIYEKKSSTGTIQLTYDDTFKPKWKDEYYEESTRQILIPYNILPDVFGCGNRWHLELPEACMYAYVREKVKTSSYIKYNDEYIGTFRDIDGVIHQLSGTGTLRIPDEGDCTYTTTVSSPSNKFLTMTQYFAIQTLQDTGIQYNLTIADSKKGLTYYMYNHAIKTESVNRSQSIKTVAVVDKFGNMIRYNFDESYNNLLKIIDTYGREINFSYLENAKHLTYTDENGVVKTIKYETETLPATELQNDSPIVGKEVNRLKVTNAQNETTIYDSREGEALAYYSVATLSLSPTHKCSSSDYIEPLWCSNIERIIYPNGAETRYKFKRYYISNPDTSSAHGVYAVVGSHDVVNGVEKNKKTYALALSSSKIVKTETNSSSGLVTVYNYDDEGMLTQSIASATGTTSGAYIKNNYTYGTNNQITAHTVNNSGLSHTANYAYRSGYPGMVTSVQETGNSKIKYTYHTVDGKATLIPQTTNMYKYNGSTYVLDYSIETTLDANSKAVEYERYIKSNVIEAQTKYTRDDYGRVISVTRWIDDTNGDGVLDSNDNTITTNTQYVYNTNGSLAVTNSIDDVSTTYNYGVTGLPNSMTDPMGYTTQVQYDNIGRATKYIYPNGATETADYNVASMFTNVKDKAGEYVWTYFNQSGLPTSKYFSNSQWRQFEANEYDTSDRLTYRKSIYDVDKYTEERYTYDILDQVLTKQVYDNGTLLYTENYTYGNGAVTKATTAEDGTAVATEKITYDAYGRVTKKEQYTADTNISTSYTYDYRGNVLTETDPMGNVTTYTYDIFNNVTSITYPDGSQEHMYYDMAGRNVTAVDKSSVEYRNTYDKLDRVTKTEVKVNDTYVTLGIKLYDRNSNLTGEAININSQTNTSQPSITYVNYMYDNMNNIIGVINDDGNNGKVTQYWYDTAGRMTKMATGLPYYYGNNTLPDSAQIIQYGYDIHSNMTSRTDQLGNVTTYTYDYAGNVKSETQGNSTITKTYGPYGITSTSVAGVGNYDDYSYTYNSMGMMNTHTSWDGTETIVYDAFGRKTSETSNGRTHLYSYDLNSRLTNYQMKNGTILENDIDYTYDNMGRTTLIDINEAVVNGATITGTQIAYTYDTSGNMTSKVQGTNRTDVVYNQYNQPVTYTNKIGDVAIGSYSYAYRWDGNVLTESDTVNNINKAYTYDFWGNLSKETITGAVNRETTYTYDLSNNRASKTVTGDENYTNSYTYNKRNQLLTETKTVNDEVTAVYTYEYNTRGERTGKHITANGATNVIAYYLYDGNGRLFQHDTGFSHPAGVSCYFYFYDALGRRIKKDGSSNDTDFTWNGDNVMAEMDTNGLTTDRYIYGVDGIAMNNSSYYFKNAHGDVVETMDNGTGIRGSYTYEAFGNKVTSPTDDTNPFQYCGEYMDDESFLIYLRNRYYDPEIGAFISEDPIYDGDNWYTYCENNPVNYVDPWGLFDFNTQLSYSPNVYSNDVLTLQNELAWNGYLTDDDIDGYFGQKTLNAVNAYKNDKGLWNYGQYNGIVGRTTWESLGLIYRTQADIDAGVTITNIGAKQYKDITVPISNALSQAEGTFKENANKFGWFSKQVGDSGPWNIKKEDNGVYTWETTIGTSFPGYATTMILRGNYVTVESVGNITYGYLGKAADFTDFVLYNASSFNDLCNHKFTNVRGEKVDQYWISVGIDWYNSK